MREKIMGKRLRPPIPKFRTPIIETHCHLDYLNSDELPNQLKKARDVGVKKFVTIAVSEENLTSTIELANYYDDVWATQGIHPHSASDYTDGTEDTILTNLQCNKVVAIGEIGLDYYYEHSEREIQKTVFEKQLKLASEVDLPVVIHTREADDDTIEILKKYSLALKKKGVIHSFTSTMKLAEFCLSEGFKLGFNGIATFKSAKNVHEVIERTPLDQIVLETDSPYLTPVPYRGKQNSPYYLPFIAKKIAEIKNIDIEILLQNTYQNSIDLFAGLNSFEAGLRDENQPRKN